MLEEYKGYEIKIEQDQDPLDPRENDNMGKMICFHKRYTLGDKTDLNSDMFDGWEELKKHLLKEENAEIILPLYVYDHSGISMRTFRFGQHSAWDCGQVGFIYATKKDILENYQVKKLTKAIKAKAEKLLIAEVEDYNKYISGDIYCFTIEKNGEIFDSGNNWYETDDIIKEAKNIIDDLVKEEKKLQLQY